MPCVAITQEAEDVAFVDYPSLEWLSGSHSDSDRTENTTAFAAATYLTLVDIVRIVEFNLRGQLPPTPATRQSRGLEV